MRDITGHHISNILCYWLKSHVSNIRNNVIILICVLCDCKYYENIKFKTFNLNHFIVLTRGSSLSF